jgi:hypothetical protein
MDELLPPPRPQPPLSIAIMPRPAPAHLARLIAPAPPGGFLPVPVDPEATPPEPEEAA